MKEVADIQEPFAAHLRKLRICFIRNRPDKKSGIKSGMPDFCVTHMGRCVFVECKLPDGRVSMAQANCISELRFNGNTVVIAHSLKECIEAVKGIGITDLKAPEIAHQEGNKAVSMERGAELASKMVKDVKANVARSEAKGKPRLKQPKQPDLPGNGKYSVRESDRPPHVIANWDGKDYVLAKQHNGTYAMIRPASAADVINLPRLAA